jgi:hypothetical protein
MRAVVLLLMLAPAVARAEDIELDIPGLESDELKGDALVWEDAQFFLEPWESGQQVRFTSVGRRREEVGRVVPVRIVDASMKAFVEIELSDRSDCTFRRLNADNRIAGLRLFVLRNDLAPVLVKPFVLANNDGTRIKLSPGVPVVPTSSGDYLITVREDRLRMPIPHSSVGWIYKPVKITDEQPTGKVVRIDRMASVRFGEDSFQIRSNWIVPVPDKKNDPALVPLNTRCVELVGSVSSSSLRPASVPPAQPPNVPYNPVATSGWRIPPGVPLATSTGREVAVAAANIGVTTPTSDNACFDARFSLLREDLTYYSVPRSFRLCARASLLDR